MILLFATFLLSLYLQGFLWKIPLSYHQFVKNLLPTVVVKYDDFDGKNPFDPIKLEGALLNPDGYNVEKHDITSALITYHTLSKMPNRSPLLLHFSLGRDMSVDTIIGIPFIKYLKL